MRGASSARGMVMTSSVSGGGCVLCVNEWTSMGLVGNTPCLHLLGDFLCVGWGEHADFASGFEVVG